MTGYPFAPATVAATILDRFREAEERGQLPHASSRRGDALEVGDGLFRLTISDGSAVLNSPFAEATLELMRVEAAEPDPLWQSVDGICSHMEQDHSDTFPLFLATVGKADEQPLSMPWVQKEGFFLSTSSGSVFIPFPTPCSDANSVRATLIKMLRKAREAHG